MPRGNKTQSTLCWDCRNAVKSDKCTWVKSCGEKIPKYVEYSTKKVTVSDGGVKRIDTLVLITKCKRFKKDKENVKSKKKHKKIELPKKERKNRFWYIQLDEKTGEEIARFKRISDLRKLKITSMDVSGKWSTNNKEIINLKGYNWRREYRNV